MNKIFEEDINEMLELYKAHLNNVSYCVCQYNMRPNPKKCTLIVRAIKFLGFYLTETNIEYNPSICNTIINIDISTTKEKIIKLNRMHTSFILQTNEK